MLQYENTLHKHTYDLL